MKTCFKCGKRKRLGEFYVHPQMGDGHLNKCKECTRHDVMRYRREHIEAFRQYDRNRAKQPHRKAAMTRTVREYKAKYPIRYRANYAVRNAVRDGRLEKASRCNHCGCTGKLCGHHEDYNKPLSVVWLCQPCHKRLHAKTG